MAFPQFCASAELEYVTCGQIVTSGLKKKKHLYSEYAVQSRYGNVYPTLDRN